MGRSRTTLAAMHQTDSADLVSVTPPRLRPLPPSRVECERRIRPAASPFFRRGSGAGGGGRGGGRILARRARGDRAGLSGLRCSFLARLLGLLCGELWFRGLQGSDGV